MIDCVYNFRWHTLISKCVNDREIEISFNIDQIYMKDAECAETNDKLFFRLSFFEFWSFFGPNWKFIFHSIQHISLKKKGGGSAYS